MLRAKRSRTSLHVYLPLFLWILSGIAIYFYQAADEPGWDWAVYGRTMDMVAAGQDPYAIGMARQAAFEADRNKLPGAQSPLQYIYPPITLPVLRIVALHRLRYGALLYWLLYGASIALTIYGTSLMAEPAEMRAIRYFAPVVLFFPGLLQQDNFLDGNISFICYGLICGAAALSLRWRKWTPFCCAVLLVACLKVPWVTLLGLPVCLDRKQWRPACITAVLCAVLFVSQQWIYPVLFPNFLRELDHEFLIHGFGVSPAGLLAMVLLRDGRPFQLFAACFYCTYASLVAAVLWRLSRSYRSGSLSIRRVLPVLLIGIFLLNPRVKDYDVAPLTIALALIIWRFCAASTRPRLALTICVVACVSANLVVMAGWGGLERWNEIEGALLVLAFAGGSWQLLHSVAVPSALPQSHRF